MWGQPGRERLRAERGEPLLRSAVPPELYPGANQRDGSVQIVLAKTFRPRFQLSGVAAQACPTSRLWCGASRPGARSIVVEQRYQTCPEKRHLPPGFAELANRDARSAFHGRR